MSSKLLRSSIRAARRAIAPEARAAHAAEVLARFTAAWTREGARLPTSAAFYHPLPEELDVTPVGRWLEGQGVKLFFPRIREHALEWVCARLDRSEDWDAHRLGMLEPKLNLDAHPDPGLEVIFVPGVAFGPEGERLGMGKGFYDRALTLFPTALRVSLAYDFQLVPALEQSAWDQPVDWILSEQREIRTCRLRDRIGELKK